MRTSRRGDHCPDFDTSITLPFGTVPAAMSVHLNVIDVQVHGWDLATATEQPATIPDDLAEESLAFVTQMLRPEMRSDAPDASFGFPSRSRPTHRSPIDWSLSSAATPDAQRNDQRSWAR